MKMIKLSPLALLPLVACQTASVDETTSFTTQRDPIGAQFANGAVGPLDAWVATYRGERPGDVNIAATLRGLGDLSGYAPIVEDDIKVYYDDCPASDFDAGCRQRSLASHWWSYRDGGDWVWRRDRSQFGPNTILLDGNLVEMGSRVLTRPLTIELPIEQTERGIFSVCRITTEFMLVQTLSLTNADGARVDFDLSAVWNDDRRELDLNFGGSSSAMSALGDIADLRLTNLGQAELGGCGLGDYCIAASISADDIPALFTGAAQLELETVDGDLYRGPLQAQLSPRRARFTCDYGTPGCVHGQAVACTGGTDRWGQAIDPSSTYCGQTICGADQQTYFCGSAGTWGSTGQVCP